MKIQISVSTKNESILENLHKGIIKKFQFLYNILFKAICSYVVNSLNQEQHV